MTFIERYMSFNNALNISEMNVSKLVEKDDAKRKQEILLIYDLLEKYLQLK